MVSYIAEILLVSDIVLSVFLIICINGIHCLLFLLYLLMLLLIHSSCSVVFFMCIKNIYCAIFFTKGGVKHSKFLVWIMFILIL